MGVDRLECTVFIDRVVGNLGQRVVFRTTTGGIGFGQWLCGDVFAVFNPPLLQGLASLASSIPR